MTKLVAKLGQAYTAYQSCVHLRAVVDNSEKKKSISSLFHNGEE